jgi:hypothetical protein
MRGRRWKAETEPQHERSTLDVNADHRTCTQLAMTPIRGPKANTGRGEAPSPDPSPVGGRKLKNEEGRVCHVLAAAESLRHVPPAQKTASHLSSKSASPSLGLLAYFRCDLRLFVAYSFLLHLIRRFAEIKVSPPR